jgi:isoquinoline 1-oxidoreductase subunit beta
MNSSINTSRRAALQAGGLGLASLCLPLSAFTEEAVRTQPPDAAALGPWIRIGLDDVVTLYLAQSEMGQSIYTGLAMILADELDADLRQVRVQDAPIGEPYRITVIDYTGRFTGGSSSTTLLMQPLRRAGAAARAMLLDAAATMWQVSVKECTTEPGMVVHRPSGRRTSYGVLAGSASRLAIPTDVKLKTSAQWRYIGKPVHRLDGPQKVDGSAVFGIDVARPGMLNAVVKHCSIIGGKITGFNEAVVKALPGVRALVPLQGDSVVVVADTWWNALKASGALELTEQPPAEPITTAAIRASQQLALNGSSGKIARREGNVVTALAAGRQLEATYESPYLAHATLEPPCCLVDVRKDSVEAWIPTQGQDVAVEVLHQILQISKERITIHTTFLGGGFGRKFKPDFLIQAAIASKATGAPVKLVWSRDQDIQHDHYRPGFMQRLVGAVNEKGQITALHARVAVQPLLGQIFEGWVRNGIDESSVEGLADTGYAIPNTLVEQHDIDAPIRLGFLRSVGQSPNAFALESFIDELAHLANRDPYAIRLELLKHDPRGLEVLKSVVQMSGWGRATSAERKLGLAYRGYVGRGGSFVTRVAEVAEVSRTAGKIKVHRVWCAVDCGLAVNPDSIRAQMEGSIGFGLGAALHGEITFAKGQVEQSNFDSYRLLTLAEMPRIDVQIMRNEHPPSGVGEPGMPPIAPAVANAWFALTGQRLRRLPMLNANLSIKT